MATVTLRDIRKSFAALDVIRGIDLQVQDREFVVFVGPSGCGKSTLLRMIAGLEEISGGDLLIDNRRVNDVSPDARGLAMVFQSYALYPHMTVAANMGFALRLAGVPKAERNAKVAEAARVLQLEQLLERRPGQLSGGQRQRVAIGRAIVRNPKVFLFDEPLSNLDASLRGQMRIELARLHRELDATMIYVTHDQIEAMTMADRIVVLNLGRIEQVGSPLELYHRPANLFVAGFIGSPRMNLIPARALAVGPSGVTIALPGGGQAMVPVVPGSLAPNEAATLGLRAEALTLSDTGALRGEVAVVEHLGGETLVYVEIGEGGLVTVKTPGDTMARVGEAVSLSFDGATASLFDSGGRAMTAIAARA